MPTPPAASAPEPRSDRARTIRAAATVAVVAVGYAVWSLASASSNFQRMVVSDVTFILVPIAAATACWRARRRSETTRQCWTFIAAGCATWGAGSVVWAVNELVLHRIAPFPSLSDVFYIGYALPVAAGLLAVPRVSRSSWSSLRLSLDTAVISTSLLFTSAVFVMHPVVASAVSTSTRLDALAYPLADVTVAAFVLSLGTVYAGERTARWLPLGLGLLVQTVTDSIYVSRLIQGDYRPGHLLDVGWVVSFLLVGFAAWIAPAAPRSAAAEDSPKPPTFLQQVLPYGPIALAGWALSRGDAAFGPHGGYFWATLLLLTVIIARQLVVAADHALVTRDLASAVGRRTAQLRQREHWWETLVSNLTDVVIVVERSGRISYCSPAVSTALGHWPRHIDTAELLLTQVHPDDVEAVSDQLLPVLQGALRRGWTECRVRRADGSWAWFEVSALGQIRDASIEGMVVTMHDVTERQRLTEELSHQAFHDTLTGLPNRALLMQRIEQVLAEADGGQVGLMLLDLDDFKVINDTHGHLAGDEVLRTIGLRLRAAIRGHDVVARLGGDEFAVLIHGTEAEMRAAADRLASVVSAPVVVGDRRFVVHASIGVVYAEGELDETPQGLLAHADIALYEAKAREKGSVSVIAGRERTAAAHQMHLREHIAHPELDQFTVVYQPLVTIPEGRLRGVEALLRWQHPELGLISPAQFVPLAEHGGSIKELGWHVLETACSQLQAWTRRSPHVRLAVGVNVSVLQLQEPTFVDRVRELVGGCGFEPDQLVLEITEQALARDFETVVGVVAELRRAGLSVAVDDFGTGYSSLRYLDRFAADVVKIDQSFVAGLQHSPHTQKLVRSVIDMAHSLELQTVAEGIETREQLAIVHALGCEIGQGYLFSRPTDPERIDALLASGLPLLDPAAPVAEAPDSGAEAAPAFLSAATGH